MPAFGKRTPFTREHFAEFEKVYGADPMGGSKRKGTGEDGRWQAFTREEVKGRGDNLDVTWLKEEGSGRSEDPDDPEEIAAQVLALLQGAAAEVEALQASLGPAS
jgi:type I restriction enzyme M protein